MKGAPIAIILFVAFTASAELPRPESATFFVEPFGGFVSTLHELDNEDDSGIEEPRDWSYRLQFGLSAGARVWDPLNLDAGIRLGISFQRAFEQDGSELTYDDSIKFFEISPFARGNIFFNETWAAAFELGLGMVIIGGGRLRSTDVPDETEMAFRFRIAVGATMRMSSSLSLTLDVGSFVVDTPLTTEWQEDVGTVFSFEPRIGLQYRFL